MNMHSTMFATLVASFALITMSLGGVGASTNPDTDYTCNYTNQPTSAPALDGCPLTAEAGETVWFHNHFASFGGDRIVTVTDEVGNVAFSACVAYSPWPGDGAGPFVLESTNVYTVAWHAESGAGCVDDVGAVQKVNTITVAGSEYDKCKQESGIEVCLEVENEDDKTKVKVKAKVNGNDILP